MKALFVSCTLKKSPEPSNTETLGRVVAESLQDRGVEVEHVRLVDHDVPPGVVTDLGEGDGWPAIHDKLLESQILVVLTPTWVGRPSSIAQRMLERMDAMLSETTDDGTPVAYNRVAGVVVTGNEDGAHHVISEISGGLVDIGYTIPGQAWVYWNQGPGPGPDYVQTGHGHEWARSTAQLMAHNLHAVATALAERPVPSPSS
ncbi:flavodoxin family protein [Cellulosimicrobium sp. NPDC057127]|uniref:flavodoxin family protein n=1 Tax=Cellulosimicrobium sp. NPDC057127 TaxID=3346026 RepID=UPI00362C0745